LLLLDPPALRLSKVGLFKVRGIGGNKNNMSEYYVPQTIENPALLKDIQQYFFKSFNTHEVEKVARDFSREMTVLCDRIELIEKLLKIRDMLSKKRKYVNPTFSKINIDGTDVIEISRDEHIYLEGIELNGFTYDLDALCQYLLLTMIDTIMGKIDYINFTEWISLNQKQEKYSFEELQSLQQKYDEENGLRRNFIKAFTVHVSQKYRQELVDSFMVSKVGLGRIDPNDQEAWLKLTTENKFDRITKYLYDEVRCKFTHSSGRSFLPTQSVLSSKPIKKKVLVCLKKPENANLIGILREIVKELVYKKYINREI